MQTITIANKIIAIEDAAKMILPPTMKIQEKVEPFHSDSIMFNVSAQPNKYNWMIY